MRPLTAECEWYQLCSEGKYLARRCPIFGTNPRQIFNPLKNNCTDNVKLPIVGQCQSYKQCLVIETVSPFGKWTEVQCGSGKYFEQESQKCIVAEISTCGKYFQRFISENLFLTNTIFCIRQKNYNYNQKTI